MTQLLNQQDGRWSISASTDTAWVSLEEYQPNAALLLDVDAEPQAAWASACLIGIDFPALTDGRGLSLAALLRQRVGFTGDLRAVGAVHEDILHFMLRCGFTSFELADDRDPEIVLGQLAPYSQHYQASVINPLPALVRLANTH